MLFRSEDFRGALRAGDRFGPLPGMAVRDGTLDLGIGALLQLRGAVVTTVLAFGCSATGSIKRVYSTRRCRLREASTSDAPRRGGSMSPRRDAAGSGRTPRREEFARSADLHAAGHGATS